MRGHRDSGDPAGARVVGVAVTPLTPDEALRVARWLHPAAASWGTIAPDLGDIAALERALIERGLAEEYGRALLSDLGGADLHVGGGRYDLDAFWMARIATASTDIRARAILCVVDEQLSKEKA